MAGTWISGVVGNYVSQFVQPAVSSSGDFAGNALAGLGNGVNGIGRSIEGSIRRYGDGAKDYGNAVKDWTNAPGSRVGTAGNPLGLTDSVTGGKNNLTRPRLQAPAPKKEDKPAPKKDAPAPPRKTQPQKALPAANGIKKAPVGGLPKTTPPSIAGSKPSGPPSTKANGSEAGGKQNTARKDRRLKDDKEDRERKANAALTRLAASRRK